MVDVNQARRPQMTLSDQEQVSRVRLARSHSIGPITYRKLILEHGSAVRAVDFLLSGKNAKKVAKTERAEQELEAAAKLGCTSLFFEPSGKQSDYPVRLAAIDDAPPLIHTLGNPDLARRPGLAVVGSRSASAAGLKLAQILVSELSKSGLIVVSGLARGIDAAAHRAALSNGTIACLAGGVDSIYPPQNSDLYHAIIERGLVVSEVAPGTQATARHFPRRNRIVSGLSIGVLVVEATARSGSLITARLAGEQGREVFAVPGSPLDARAEGTNRLLKDGAILVRNIDDILSEIETLLKHQHHTSPKLLDVTTHQSGRRQSDIQTMSKPAVSKSGTLEDLIATTPIHIDEIVRISGMTTEGVLQELQLLELDGKIERHTGGRYSKV